MGLDIEPTVYVIRHGQSTYNLEGRWAGHENPPLTELGRAQARSAAERLHQVRFRAVTSSGLVRARETASILADTLQLPLLPPRPEFNERHAGALAGLTWAEIGQRFPSVSAQWKAKVPIEVPGGEGWKRFTGRIDRAVQAVEKLEHLPLLVVAHAGVLRALTVRAGQHATVFDNLEGLWASRAAD